ncbi:FG-GAP repeat domain-containing protein [Flexithrix dorotheae]|uniref:FG-GAP repeat domain-containing protein n=1 Tax=Flexithrix dorotheae TaxID=70993 RepID=UPI0003626D2C|nr:VCBS repeat-containing protein [Flexithrix dorotheae]
MKLIFPVFFVIIFISRLYAQEVLPPKFEAQVIDNVVEIGYGLAIGDVDGDQNKDILMVDKKQVVWYRNPDWKRFVIAENLTERDNVCIAARDVDGDGRVEVAVGAQWNPGETSNKEESGAVFYLAAPENPEEMWEAIPLFHTPTVHRMHWVKIGQSNFQLVMLPLHGEGNNNGEGDPVKVIIYDLPSKPSVKNAWQFGFINTGMHKTHNFDIVTDEKTGAEGLLIAGQEGVKIYKNNLGRWDNGEELPKVRGAGEVRWGTSNKKKNDRFLVTIEAMHGHELVFYDNFKFGKRKVLTGSLNQGHALACADLLGKDFDQVVVGWRNKDNEEKVGIKLFVPDKRWSNWKSYIIDDDNMACEDLKIADLDNDGKPDIIASGRATNNLIVYWNRSELSN